MVLQFIARPMASRMRRLFAATLCALAPTHTACGGVTECAGGVSADVENATSEPLTVVLLDSTSAADAGPSETLLGTVAPGDTIEVAWDGGIGFTGCPSTNLVEAVRLTTESGAATITISGMDPRWMATRSCDSVCGSTTFLLVVSAADLLQ